MVFSYFFSYFLYHHDMLIFIPSSLLRRQKFLFWRGEGIILLGEVNFDGAGGGARNFEVRTKIA